MASPVRYAEPDILLMYDVRFSSSIYRYFSLCFKEFQNRVFLQLASGRRSGVNDASLCVNVFSLRLIYF